MTDRRHAVEYQTGDAYARIVCKPDLAFRSSDAQSTM